MKRFEFLGVGCPALRLEIELVLTSPVALYSSAEQTHKTKAKCDPKQNPKRQPQSGHDIVRVKELTAPFAAETPLPAQDKDQGKANAANDLRRDRRILGP